MSNPEMSGLAVVVGAGPGIGAAAARLLASRGFVVGAIARSQSSLDALGGPVHGVAADAGDADALTAAIHTLQRAYGPARILIYNAAVLRADKAAELSGPQLLEALAVDVAGAATAVQAVREPMRRAGGGGIVLTGGGLALAPDPDVASLSVGKAALRAYALALAPSLQPEGIRVRTVTVVASVGAVGGVSPDDVARAMNESLADDADVERILGPMS